MRRLSGVLAIASLLVVVAMSVLVTRVASAMLVHTGISRDMARFQARSAFSGTGFTTSETEALVNHPVRRRIISTLMMFGNVGIVTTVSSLILAFVNTGDDTGHALERFGLLVAGLALLWLLARSKWLDRRMMTLIEWMLKRFTRLEVSDYEGLLHLTDDYRVVELAVGELDWVAGKSLTDSRIRKEGLLVLAIKRADGGFLGAPMADSMVWPGDTLLVYGPVEIAQALDRRKKGAYGDKEHLEAIAAWERIRAEQAEADLVRTEAIQAKQRASQLVAMDDVRRD